MARQCSEFDDSTHSGFILLLDAPSVQLYFVGWEKNIALIIQAPLAALIVINSPIQMFRFSALQHILLLFPDNEFSQLPDQMETPI
jgi:hypothetical protein